jgi:hypothetical protein
MQIRGRQQGTGHERRCAGSAAKQLELSCAGLLPATEPVEAHIWQIERLNSGINAFADFEAERVPVKAGRPDVAGLGSTAEDRCICPTLPEAMNISICAASGAAIQNVPDNHAAVPTIGSSPAHSDWF